MFERSSSGWIFFLVLLGFSFENLVAQSTYKEIDVRNGGTICGTVRLKGECPKIASMQTTKDPKYCGKEKNSPRLIVSKLNGVKNSIVCLEHIAEGKKFSLSNQLLCINQQHCEYSPHITILPFKQNLEIVNNDPILHNVHAYSAATTSRSMFNIAQPIKGQRTTVKQNQLNTPGLMTATCDAGHPWMSAYIMVVEHPYFSITDADGKFSMDNIPPGNYTVKMWHEGVSVADKEIENGKVKKYFFEEPYEITKEVTVPANGNVTVDFDLTLR